MNKAIAFYTKAKKAVHAQALLVGTWAAAALGGGVTGVEWIGLVLVLSGGPVVYATSNRQ